MQVIVNPLQRSDKIRKRLFGNRYLNLDLSFKNLNVKNKLQAKLAKKFEMQIVFVYNYVIKSLIKWHDKENNDVPFIYTRLLL